ncbi:hypothetical protein Val02_46300 [Virgisporangium aliadipatigenens]|uniref:NUDIX hydrolase n=2 Tax=Virgisporangium aliadipatigenens TaxID=741659 RepID=A0A8J3YLM1_9ACTN|nr:hypothetical protein Val02_46300 [Virgisporangium aliadipatigenens]
MWWLAGAAVLVVLLGLYVFWMSGRVDRCHARASAAQAALDAHLVRRAAAALALAGTSGDEQLRWAARVALDAAHDEREAAENDLTRVLREHHKKVAGSDPDHADDADVVAASRRAALARQVHNDLVRDALSLRRRRLVRLLRLARRHARPAYFDIDDPVLDRA